MGVEVAGAVESIEHGPGASVGIREFPLGVEHDDTFAESIHDRPGERRERGGSELLI